MIGQILLWTLATILAGGVGGGCLYGVFLSYRDQHALSARRKFDNVRSGR